MLVLAPATISKLITQMNRLVIFNTIGPPAPDDSHPPIGQAAIGVRGFLHPWPDHLKVGGSPARLRDGTASELGSDPAEFAITSAAEENALTLATLLGHGAGTGNGLHDGRSGIPGAAVAELGQQRGGQEVASAWQGGKDMRVGMLLKGQSQAFFGCFALISRAEA